MGNFAEPWEWTFTDWLLCGLTAPILALLVAVDGESKKYRWSAGHRVSIGTAILQLALVWHFVHYPATFQVPAEVAISTVVVAAYGLYDATLAVYYAVPPWTVTTGLALAGVVPLASGLWPVLRGGE